MESWREELECTICLDYSVSPIHNCTNGHIVCGLCVEQISRCGLCKEGLSISFLAERLTRRYPTKLPCRNTTQGCSKLIKSTGMKEHLSKECDYGPVQCPVLENKCSETLIKQEDLEHHLKEVHNVLIYPDKHLSTFTFAMQPDFSDTVVVVKWFDGRMFLMHYKLQLGFLYVWVSVIGDQSVADGYSFVINPKLTKYPTTAVSYSCNLRVLPIRQSEFARANELGYVGIVDARNLFPLCEEWECPVNETKPMYILAVNSEIMKK